MSFAMHSNQCFVFIVDQCPQKRFTFKSKNTTFKEQLDACTVLRGRFEEVGLSWNIGQGYSHKLHSMIAANKRCA